MSDLVKIGAAFSFIVALLRLRWNLGLVMFAVAVSRDALPRRPLRPAKVFFLSAVDPVTINLVAGLVLIMVLENIMRKRACSRSS